MGTTDGTSNHGERRLTVSVDWLGVKPPPFPIRMRFHDGTGPLHARVRCATKSAPEVQDWLKGWPAHDVRIARRGATATVHARLARRPGSALPEGLLLRRLEVDPNGRARLKVEGPPPMLDALAKKVNDGRRLHAGTVLTARQRKALAVAVEMGYYVLPRPVTLREMADRLETSPSSLSELLRRAEATLVLAYARTQAWPEAKAKT